MTNLTNPQPLLFIVFESMIIVTSLTSPYFSQYARKSCCFNVPNLAKNNVEVQFTFGVSVFDINF